MRLFLAVPLPPELASRLDPAVAALAARGTWNAVPAHRRHVTFGFLGERPAADVPAILRTARAVAAAHAAFGLDVAGVGAFPAAGRPSVVFAEGRAGAEACGALAGALAEALAIGSGGGAARPAARSGAAWRSAS